MYALLTPTTIVKVDRFFAALIHKVGKIGIFVLLKFGNKEDKEMSDFKINSKQNGKCQFSWKLIKARNYCTKMPMLSALCITGKLEYTYLKKSRQCLWTLAIRVHQFNKILVALLPMTISGSVIFTLK